MCYYHREKGGKEDEFVEVCLEERTVGLGGPRHSFGRRQGPQSGGEVG
jgi:hypothetical protein